ncbi:MAG: hypothetical protein IJC78_06285 [Clostridia bacterium]|nr:hypothetical protein [Clostridia bacterium]
MTKKLAFASVLTALTAIFLCASVYLPTGRIAFLMLSTFCILVTQAECGTRYSLLAYVASSAIGLLFLPIKLQLLLFVAFLGYYPIVKRYIEQIQNLWLEWPVKILFFSAVLVVAYFAAQYILIPRIELGIVADYVFSHLPAIVLAAEVIFVIYDILLTMLASYYMNVIQPKLRLW